MKRFTKALKATTIAFAAAGLMVSSAMATDGMFGNGTGARNKALAGAGVANEKDATAMSLNPAGLVHSENQLNISASLFSPRRENEGEYNGAPGAVVESDSQYFVIPNIAYSHRVDGNTVFGLSMYGNGGMNTDYPYAGTNPFGGTGSLGIDLTQIFMSAGLAKQYGNFSVGIAPIVAIQIFQADGIQNFSEETNVAVGIAVRGGVEWALTPNFRVGVAGATPTYMQAFTDYDTTLFAASDGELRLPATIQAGIAFDLTPSLTIMADYKRIFYGEVKAIGTNPPNGFGWDNMNIYKFGVEWATSSDLTLRAGYSYNDAQIDSGDAQQNIIAPGVVQHHFTGGAMIRISDTMDLELAGMYAPEETVSGDFYNNVPAPVNGGTKIRMYQWELTAGVKWKLGTPEAPLK